MNYSHKDPDEIEYFGVDFAARLAAGETIQTATFHIEVIEGADPAAASMLMGVSTISGSIARQKIGAGVAGAHYRVSAHVVTSTGQTLVESGALSVKESG